MKNIIKILAALIILAAVILLATGCSMSAHADSQLVNPMQEVTREEVAEIIDIDIYVPKDAEDVRFFTITADKDPALVQMDFRLNGKAYTFRAAVSDLQDAALSGVYFTAPDVSIAQILGTEGVITTQDLTSVLMWTDITTGTNCSLVCTDCEDSGVLLDVAEEIFRGEQTTANVLAGLWKLEDSSFVEIVPAENRSFDVLVSIYRLTQFSGTGEIDSNSMKMIIGDTISARFFLAEDGTGTLIITDSDWNLLESGTEFTGFVKA